MTVRTNEDAVRVQDRAAIERGLYAYCRFADLNRADQQTLVFTDDCRVSYGGPGKWIVGRDRLAEALRGGLAAYAATSHLVGNVEIDFTADDGADVQSVVQAWHRPVVPGPDVVLYGRYVDRWVQTDQGWRIAVREFRAAGATGRDESTLNPLGREPIGAVRARSTTAADPA